LERLVSAVKIGGGYLDGDHRRGWAAAWLAAGKASERRFSIEIVCSEDGCFDTLICQGSPEPLGYPAGLVIGRLSAGDLRGTNPANPADRHNAVMLEAWDLLHPAANRPVKRPAPARQGWRAKRSKPQQRQQPDGSVGIAEVQGQDRTGSAAR